MSGAPGEAGGSAPPARPAVPATGETAPGGKPEKAEEREETGKRFRRIRLFLTGFSPLFGVLGARTWQQPRVVYLQNANDPIVWWSPSLAFHVPGWLKGPRGPGVSPVMHWYPLVTFWRVTADMADSTSVPPGQGHVYSALEGASAWASIIAPSGWTPERTAALARQPDD